MAQYFSVTDEHPFSDSSVRAAIYSRQSHNKKKSIGQQTEECEEEAEANRWPVVAKYSDGTPASRQARKERDDWQQLLADFQLQRWNILILWESSRGDRTSRRWQDFLEDCRRLKIRIHLVSARKTYDVSNPFDWKTLADEGNDNQLETDKIAIRVSRATRKNAQAGKPHGKPAYGYKRTYELINNKPEPSGQEPDLGLMESATGDSFSPAGIVKDMFRDFLAGAGIKEIARDLNARRIPTANHLLKLKGGQGKTTLEDWINSEWTESAVRYILGNVAYVGVRMHHRCEKGEVHVCAKSQVPTKANWKGLVSAETFEAVQKKLRLPERNRFATPGVQSKAKHLLSCIARCRVCNDDMLFLGASPKHGRPNPHYRCRKSHAAVPVARSEAFVTAWVLSWLALPGNWDVLRASESGTAGALAEAQFRLEGLVREYNELEAKVKDGSLKAMAGAIAMSALEDQMEVARRDVASLNTGLPTALKDFAGKTLDEIESVWLDPSFDGDNKRAVIASICTISVAPAGKGNRNPSLRGRLFVEPRIPGTSVAEQQLEAIL